MNLKFYAMAVVLSFLPLIQSYAGAERASLREIDFSHAEVIVKGSDSLIEFDLSAQGQEKIKHLNSRAVNKKVTLSIGNKSQAFTWRGPIVGDKLEVGPVTHIEAEKIIARINAH
jgi:hypothetical protein